MVLLFAKRLEGDDPMAGQNGCLFSALLQNSHGNQALGVAAFYSDRCQLFMDSGCVTIHCPAHRVGFDGNHAGPFFAEYSEACNGDTVDAVPFVSVKVAIKSVRKGLFLRRRYSEFSFRALSPDGPRRWSVTEYWDSEHGHTWSLLGEKAQTLAAVKEIPDPTEQGLVTYHLYFTERENMNVCLVLGCILMMTAAGILPGGPRFTEMVTRLVQTKGPDHAFFSEAERDEWGSFSSAEQ